jgi:hypothetical protein
MKTILTMLAVLVAAFTAKAEPVTLSRSEGFELHQALTALSPGLSPENTLAAADDINALDADARAYKLAATKVVQAQYAANQKDAAPALIIAFQRLDEDFAAKADNRKTYDLTLFSISKDELKASTGVTAAQIAVIRRLLKADAKPEAKAAAAAPPH